MQRGSSHSTVEGLTLQVMVPLETIGSNAHSEHSKGTQMDLFKLAQLDGTQTGLGPWLLGSLSSSVVLFVMRQQPSWRWGSFGAFADPALCRGKLLGVGVFRLAGSRGTRVFCGHSPAMEVMSM